MMDLNVEMTLQAQKDGTSTSSSSVIVTDRAASSSHSVPSPSQSSSASPSHSSSAKTVAKGKEKLLTEREKKLKLWYPSLVPKCKVKVALGQMRKYVGAHIQKGTLSGCNICGFCGRDVCINCLVPGTKNSSKQVIQN